MSKKLRIILLFLVLALLVAVITWRYTFKKSDVSMASQKTFVEIEATKLLQEFETNENAADTKYRDKVIVVSGSVESVTQDSLGISVYLREGDAISGISCRFDRQALEPGAIHTGTKVLIKGMYNGYLMDVVMNKCSLAREGD